MAEEVTVTKIQVTNRQPGPRGVRPVGGALKLLEPGETFTGEFATGEVNSMRRRGDLQLTEVAPARAAALEEHTVAELKAIAAAEGVDLTDKTRKADIIAAIEAKRAAA